MKYNKRQSVMKKIRHGLAGTFACAVVLGVPMLSLIQLGHIHSFSHRSAKALPAMQVRPIDKTSAQPVLFKQPLISVTFDDGYETTYNEALPILQKHGIRSTQYILSGVEKNPLYLSWDQVTAMQKAGHEIGCHTVTHPDLRTLSDDDVMSQLEGCKESLGARFGTITDFASPYGSADNRTRADIKKVFASQRNTDGDSSNGVTFVDVNTAAHFDPMNIIGMTVKRDTTPQEIQQLIDYAVANNGWLVLTYHQADDGPSKYGLDPQKLDQQMAILQKAPARIVTVHQAISSYKGGK
jgi:peptidoglycan/xylan/chitin deacetylase (PgdA/CDA1 family)